MRFRATTVLLAALAFVAACSDSTAPREPSEPLQTARVIPGQYIVVYKDHVGDAINLTQRILGGRGITPIHTYDAALKGFAARLSPAMLEQLRNDPTVAYIEEDQEYTIEVTQNMDANGDPWGLDRIDQTNLPLSRTYTYTATGSGVRNYIIDTGISTSHSQFSGRASNVYDAFGGNGQDCHGHGTHVAGTVGATTWGIAKQALLRGVRVLNCSGSGSTSGIIAGINWVRTNHIKPAVANLSLGGGFSSSLNTAVNNLAAAGVFVAVAAGNSNANACNFSPASATGVFSTASSTRTDAKSSFSNFGSCVDGYAPGSSIKSTWLSGGTNTISGTSMASPHIAGVATLYKSANGDASQSTITTWIINNASNGVISGNPSGTPNRLVNKRSL
jgi:subtilisin family serine protease